MRLSDVLNRAADGSYAQVENFLGLKRVPWGNHRNIRVGRLLPNYQCERCADQRTFTSGEWLSCLVTGPKTVSIDAAVQCVGCESPVEIWFIVHCRDDLFGQAPTVRVERRVEHRRAGLPDEIGELGPAELLFRAQLAYQNNLGAGAMIYLRQLLEYVTRASAEACNISRFGKNHGRKPFKDLLTEVDSVAKIIPAQFSGNGYKLFSELSVVIHGEGTERDAMDKFGPCRTLVEGVLMNIEANASLARAIGELGWHAADEASSVVA